MELRRGEKCSWTTAQQLGSSRTVQAVKYKTVVRWQMGLFSVWHSGRIISQILVPVDVDPEWSTLIGRDDVATPAPLCHKEQEKGMHAWGVFCAFRWFFMP